MMRTALASAVLLVLCAGAAAAQFTPRVETITVSPLLPNAADPLRVIVTGQGVCGASAHPELYPPQISGDRIVLKVFSHHNCSPPALFEFAAEFLLAPLPAGTWTVAAVIDEEAPFEKTVEVDPATQALLLHMEEFRVQVEWSTPNGDLHGNGYAVPLSKEAGYFWFFQGSNPEILVKILDGRPVNGHWWVFISSNTNLQFTVHVEQLSPLLGDPPFSFRKSYTSPAGANKNFIDTTTFGSPD